MPHRFGVRGNVAINVFPGAKFGMLTVIRKLPKELKPSGSGYYYKTLCKCDCGEETIANTTDISRGLTKSCGCNQTDAMNKLSRQMALEVGPHKGERFDRLTVIIREEIDGKFTDVVICKCDCGNETRSNIDGLKRGNSRSCGCLASELLSKRNEKNSNFEGFKRKYPTTYSVWQGMKLRCYNEKTPGYNHYGAKGIYVCEGLQTDPRNLVKLIGFRESRKMTLDRFPIHNGNYTCGECSECRHMEKKKNVRWATCKEQQRNKGDFNVRLTAFGKTRCKSEWIELSGLPDSTVGNRLKRGWSLEKAITTPNKLGHGYDPITDKDRKQP